ncbi:hypothetical protein [Micromonospora tarensis]|nr:hypothetical protein [Micromonospora tarensis]
MASRSKRTPDRPGSAAPSPAAITALPGAAVGVFVVANSSAKPA